MSLSISTSTLEGVAIVHVSGEVDVSNASELRDALDQARKQGATKTVVDLSEVPYMDSTGIGALVRAAHLAKDAGAAFSVARPQRNVLRVLSMLGVSDDLGVSE